MCEGEKREVPVDIESKDSYEVNDRKALPPSLRASDSEVAAVLLPGERPPDYVEIDLPIKAEYPGVDDGEVEPDPWDLPDFTEDNPDNHDGGQCGRLATAFRVCLLPCLLFIFICSLDLLSSAFRLVGGKAAGSVFQNSALLQNPVAGLMIGILATVLVQSSSTSTSIVVTMVASGIIGVGPSIPIIMGANIGTSVTNTIVSMSQSGDRNEFRRAFGGATVHDMFNWMAVLVLLPIEVTTGYLYHLTKALVGMYNLNTVHGESPDMLKKLTKPVTSLIIQLNKKVLEKIATGNEEYADHTLIKRWCKFREENVLVNMTLLNETIDVNNTGLVNQTVQVPIDKCKFLFNAIPELSDTITGLILLVLSLVLLCSCLVFLVKILNILLKGSICKVIRKTLNADLPGKLSYFTGYIAMLIGAGMTILVQSSSVFTSAMTPLVGVGIIKLERMYPLTLGSNIGTTATGLLAAMAASGDKLEAALQIALCHLFFNISAILLFYPFPFTRVPIKMAKIMGDTTAKYRWFAVFYLLMMFFALPVSVFALSMWGVIPLAVIGGTFLLVSLVVIIVNIIQRKKPELLPYKLRNWEFLPEWMHSLDPLDRQVRRIVRVFHICFPCCCRKKKPIVKNNKRISISVTPPPSYSSGSFTDDHTPDPSCTVDKNTLNFEDLKIPLEMLAKQSQNDADDQTKPADVSITDSGYCTQVNSTMVSRVNSTFILNNTIL